MSFRRDKRVNWEATLAIETMRPYVTKVQGMQLTRPILVYLFIYLLIYLLTFTVLSFLLI